MSVSWTLGCVECDLTYDGMEVRYRCDCGGTLEVRHDRSGRPAPTTAALDAARASSNPLDRSGVWRFRNIILPLESRHIVSRGEGNTTLYDIAITDDVDTLLDVTNVAIASDGTASCADPDSNAQTVTCSIDELDPGESATVTVTFLTVPLLETLQPDTGQTSGANYVFYFDNGYLLYGSTEAGTATLIGPDGAEVVDGWSVVGVNQDVFFNAPGGDSFNLHLSCSEVFIDGYGQSGPTLADNPDWQVAAYQVDRFNTQGNFKDCGQFFAPFNVVNVAEASADTPTLDATDTQLSPNPVDASDTLDIINPAPIEVTRQRLRRGQVEIQYFNTSRDPLEIDIILIQWDESDQRCDVLEDASYRDGTAIDVSDVSVSNGTISMNAGIDSTILDARSRDWLRLSFDCNRVPSGLTITIVTSDGSTLEYVY